MICEENTIRIIPSSSPILIDHYETVIEVGIDLGLIAKINIVWPTGRKETFRLGTCTENYAQNTYIGGFSVIKAIFSHCLCYCNSAVFDDESNQTLEAKDIFRS